MKRLNKMVLSSMLIVTMLFSICPTAFADASVASKNAASDVVSDSYTQEIENGYLFCTVTESQAITILTDEVENQIEINITNRAEPNTLYQFMLQDYPILSPSEEFWGSLIEYGNAHLEDATVIHVNFVHETYEVNNNEMMPFSSAGADLIADLESVLGMRYDSVNRYGTSIGGHTIKVNETLSFQISQSDKYSWYNNPGLTVGSIINTIIGAVTTSTLVQALSTALGVIISVGSLVPASGAVNEYRCRALYGRYGTVDGYQGAYSSTVKNIDYKGYEDASDNNTRRAYMDFGSGVTGYAPSASYFNDYEAQALDTYNIYAW